MWLPDYKFVVELNADLIAATGGIVGVRDKSLLHSAIEGVNQTMFGEELYPTLVDKVAHIGYSIIKNHVFSDGNKRTGTMIMLITLEMNDETLNDKLINQLEPFITRLAAGSKTLEDLKHVIREITK